MILAVMGVTGSGKTTIGRMLAVEMECPFYDADDFHSAANKEKMAKGVPLTDEDRLPWLQELHARIREWGKNKSNAVLACSALKQSYRDLLSAGVEVKWIYLKGDPETLRQRIKGRRGHFAGPDLLQSQFEALEEPRDAIWVDVRKDLNTIVQQILQELKGTKEHG